MVGWLSSVLRPRQHNIGHMRDDFYTSKDPTNSIKVLDWIGLDCAVFKVPSNTV